MALWSHKKEFIFKAVEEMYTDVASRPGALFHFPTGRLACLFVGYPADQLDCLPEEATESFAGVGYPFAACVIRQGDAVLDVGSGSGTDTLIAAMLTGPSGVVYGLDMTRAMREKLQRIVAATKIGQVRVIEGNAEHIPLPDASIDVVTSNGVLNLVPENRPRLAKSLESSSLVPSARSLMFAGFRSRWMTRYSWAASTASTICRAVDSASSSGSGPRVMRSASVGPSTSTSACMSPPSSNPYSSRRVGRSK
jgi:2-polyprenyl-3-methyl-5-hydroxy-6-metoxy-1,4-benzoquinol methylase